MENLRLDLVSTSALRRFARIAGLVVAGFGLLVLLGWFMALRFPARVGPGDIAMAPSAAASFLLSGIALGLAARSGAERASRIGVRGCALAVASLGLFVGLEHVLPLGLGIDRVVFRAISGGASASAPPPMAALTAANFAIVGLGLLALDRGEGMRVSLSQGLFLLAAAVSYLAFLAYVYDLVTYYDVAAERFMPVHTAVVFVPLCLGALCARPNCGFMAVLCGDAAGGRMARFVLPAVIGVPLLLGSLKLLGEWAGYFDKTFGLSLLIVCSTVALIVVIWWSALSLERMDRVRAQIARAEAEARKRLEGMNQDLEAFSYSLAHDLVTPLRGIFVFSQALIEDHADRLDEEGKGYLVRMGSEAKRMSVLIDAMLDLSRATRSELRRERVDLAALAEAVVGRLRGRDPGRAVGFSASGSLVVEGDPRMLQAAMENLLGNAWKFTGNRPAARIELGCRRGDGADVFYVRDNGVGFDMDHAGKLFLPFHRLHRGAEFPGTGVGLATVQRIVRRHGGRIWAEAWPDRGATFYFTLSPDGREEHP